MNAQDGDFDATRAKEALAEADRRVIKRPMDRRIHGWADIGFAVLLGAWIGLGRLTYADGSAPLWALFGFMALVVALATWQSRAALTWPRRARTVGMVGLAFTCVIAAVAHMGLNWYAQDHSLELPLLAAVSAAIALPLVAAGVCVMRPAKR